MNAEERILADHPDWYEFWEDPIVREIHSRGENFETKEKYILSYSAMADRAEELCLPKWVDHCRGCIKYLPSKFR